MPCRDRIPNEKDRVARSNKLANLSAALCGILTLIEKDIKNSETNHNTFEQFLTNIDWDAAGVNMHWLADWWSDHKSADAAWQEAKAKEQHDRELRESAIKKLSPDELRVLGI